MITLFKHTLKANKRDLKPWITSHISIAAYSAQPHKLNTNIAYIRKLNDKDVVNITLRFIDETPRVNKTLIFQRPINDSIEQSMERMKEKVQKLLVRKKFGKRTPSADEIAHAIGDIEMSLQSVTGANIQCIDWQQLLNKEPAIVEDCVLKIRDQTYSLALNYPYASYAELPSCIIVGYECYPSNLELQNTSKEECLYKWFKGVVRNSKNPKDLHGIRWLECGNSFSYCIQAEDVGHVLKVVLNR